MPLPAIPIVGTNGASGPKYAPTGSGKFLASLDPRSAAPQNGAAIAVRHLFEVGLLTAFVTLLSAVHLAAVARPVYVLGALILAWMNLRRSPWQYLAFSLWIWTTAPFARRLVDYLGGFQPSSIILVAPNLLAVLMLKQILTSSTLLRRKETALGGLLLIPVIFGLVVSFFKGEIFPGIVGSIDWVIPLIYFFYIIDLSPRIGELEEVFKHFIPVNLAVISCYGIWQTFDATAWDMAWVENVKMFTMAGTSGLYSVKPFSMLNSPGNCAMWMSFSILASLHYRNRLSIVVLPAALFFLILMQVRANLAAILLGLGIAVFLGNRQILRSLALFAAVFIMVGGILSVSNPRLVEVLVTRFSTVNNLDQDLSAEARKELYRQLPDLMAEYPLGLGIGGIGRGAVAGNHGDTNADFVSVDGGPVAIYLALGWIAGTVYFLGTIMVIGAAMWTALKSRSPPATALAISALAGGMTMIFTNLVGLQGVVIWLPTAAAMILSENAGALGTPYANSYFRGTSSPPPPLSSRAVK
jgi:hypothetical protein